jgi:outer membrane protein OmpA-like peptidoglycan-associated protein
MRKWSAVLAMSALVALPLCAQEQKNDVASESAKAAALAAAKSGSHAVKAEPAARNAWGFSGAVRTSPFATAANAKSSNEDEPGRTTPKWEASVGYSYTSFHPGVPFDDLSLHGASGGFAFNVHKYLGLVVDFGGGRFSRRLSPTTRLNGGVFTYLFGPRLNLRRFDRFVPFAEFLVGGARSGGALTGTSNSGYDSFAVATGGGVDVVLTRNLAWRFAQIDFLMTNFSGPTVGGNSRQDNLRLGSGLVFRFGNEKRVPPPPPNREPVASCSASLSSVYAGSGDVVTVHVNASDPDYDALTYSYTATGGTVEGSGPDARWNTAGLGVGAYTVNAKVDDGKGGNATCAADIKVEQRANRPPVISCSAERSPILVGEHTKINCNASDPDGDPLTYSCKTTGGQVSGSGPAFDFDSTGTQAGSYKVTCTVDDGRGGTADSSATVDVQAPPPPPQASKIGDCSYKANITRVDNVCKRVGDDVALRLKNEPNAKVVIVGFADPKEKGAAKLGATRADLFKQYLGEKGIDASRISTRTGTAQSGADTENRRIDIIFVPEGATY